MRRLTFLAGLAACVAVASVCRSTCGVHGRPSVAIPRPNAPRLHRSIWAGLSCDGRSTLLLVACQGAAAIAGPGSRDVGLDFVVFSRNNGPPWSQLVKTGESGMTACRTCSMSPCTGTPFRAPWYAGSP